MSREPNQTDEQPVMLALSTFRQSEKAVELALEKSRQENRRLVVVHVADRNLARYLVGQDLAVIDGGVFTGLRQKCEEDLLREHESQGREKAGAIAARARERGIAVSTVVETGRFALVCLEVVAKERPAVIFTTRSKRPAWVKLFFGAPVDKLIAEAGCPVVEA